MSREIFGYFAVFHRFVIVPLYQDVGSFEEEVRLARGVRQPVWVAVVLRSV
jgi:hypothetical protein